MLTYCSQWRTVATSQNIGGGGGGGELDCQHMTTFCSLKPKLLKNYCYSFVTQLFSYHSNNFFEGRTVANTPYPPVSVTGCSLHVLDYLLTCKTCFLPYVASETSLIYVRVPIVSTRGVQIRSETDPIRCTPIVSTVIINKTY
jgi:hypothetical protein